MILYSIFFYMGEWGEPVIGKLEIGIFNKITIAWQESSMLNISSDMVKTNVWEQNINERLKNIPRWDKGNS